jgi:hypothetical protein
MPNIVTLDWNIMRSSYGFIKNTKNGSIDRGRNRGPEFVNAIQEAKKLKKSKTQSSTMQLITKKLLEDKNTQHHIKPTNPEYKRLHAIKRRHRHITSNGSLLFHHKFAMMCIFLLAVSSIATASNIERPGLSKEQHKAVKGLLRDTCMGSTVNTLNLTPTNKIKNMTLSVLNNGTWAPVSCVQDEIYFGSFGQLCLSEFNEHKSIVPFEMEKKRTATHARLNKEIEEYPFHHLDYLLKSSHIGTYSYDKKLHNSFSILKRAVKLRELYNAGIYTIGNCGEHRDLALLQIFDIAAQFNTNFNLSIGTANIDKRKKNHEFDHTFLFIEDDSDAYICDPWNRIFQNVQLKDHVWDFYYRFWDSKIQMPIVWEELGSGFHEVYQNRLKFISQKIKVPLLKNVSFFKLETKEIELEERIQCNNSPVFWGM